MENKILTIKKLENGRLYIDLHKYLITLLIPLIFIFPFVLLSTKNIIISLLFTLAFWVLISVIMNVNDYFGKKVHHKIFERKIFQDLKFRNFKKEIIDKYEGLIKTESGRTVRVFYNWNKVAEGPFSFGDIEINIFFQPQIFENIVDDIKIKELNKKYNNFWGTKTKQTIFAFDRLKIFINYYPWTTSIKIENEISQAMEILQKNNLAPFDISNLNTEELINLYKDGYFLPNMEYVWEYFEKNKELPIISIK